MKARRPVAKPAPRGDRKDPFGTAPPPGETGRGVTVSDAVRHCRWIAVDINAEEFGLFIVNPSLERAHLMPCFDSDFPQTSGSTRFVAGRDGEEMVRLTRASTLPFWWSDIDCPAETAFRAQADLVRIGDLTPCSPGIAFPVFADRGQCGLVMFFGKDIVLAEDQIFDIHGRCFALFNAMAMVPSEGDRTPAMSKRELECLKLSANGLTSDEIASSLKLSVHTANQYLSNSAQKLNAVNRMHAVAKAIRMGLID
jgi:DNA-binding CsgD family transcriptional regulator